MQVPQRRHDAPFPIGRTRTIPRGAGEPSTFAGPSFPHGACSVNDERLWSVLSDTMDQTGQIDVIASNQDDLRVAGDRHMSARKRGQPSKETLPKFCTGSYLVDKLRDLWIAA